MQKKYLLPPLSEECIITNENCWEAIATPYDFLLKNMQLYYEPNVSIFEGGSNAIPHAYEQMLIFHKAFFDEHHPEHHRAVLEWRAVLMIMALQKIKNLHLELVKVDLLEDSKNPFIRAATRLCPEDNPAIYHTTWDFLYVLQLKGTSIAIFSPMTLVCPAKQFFKKIKDNINPEWITLEKINGMEELFVKTRKGDALYSNLVEWLERLEPEITYANGEDGECTSKVNIVKAELIKFIEFCRAEGGDRKDSSFTIKKNIYPSIDNSIRKEYDFLNFCCDFNVSNSKFDFLLERYEEDIFAERLIVIVQDQKPDAMENSENIPRLDGLFHNTVEIKGEPIVRVKEYGGQRVAAYVLLPFRKRLVNELVQNNISAEEFFEEFSVIYNPTKEQMEILFQIKGFPYVYEKAYRKECWDFVYGNDIAETYIWPKGCVDALRWKLYYTYVGYLNSNIQISVPMAEKQITYQPKDSTQADRSFQLSRTEAFPTYICFTSKEAMGYLPVKSGNMGQRYVGSILDVFIDMGHTTTSVAMVKRKKNEDKEIAQRVTFSVSPSIQITGEKSENNSAKSNFIGTDVDKMGKSYFKNMIHRFDAYASAPVSDSEMGTMGKGQVLYSNSCYGKRIKDAVVSFLNFEYIYLPARDRENAHLYIQQILLNIVYQAIQQECSYLKVHFIHPYADDNNTNVGELYGLWKSEVERVKGWTGIYKAFGEAVNGLQNYKALAYSTCYLMQNRPRESSDTDSAGHVHVGMDIGWKQTCAVFLMHTGEGTDRVEKVPYAQLEYAGRDISFMRDDEAQSRHIFRRYAEMLSILLNGTNDYDKEKNSSEILLEFEKMYREEGDWPKNQEYYQGIFDVIAMMIEEKNLCISSDIYNNMEEFRNFIGMLTYNILLLFLEIGMLLGRVEGKMEKVTLYLSGNGAKFLKWISNEKDYYQIDSSNCNKLWMMDLKESVLDIIEAGFCITKKEKGKGKLDIKIILQENMKEQLLEGYIYKEVPELFGKDVVVPDFEYETIDTVLREAEKDTFENALDKLYQQVFCGEKSEVVTDEGPKENFAKQENKQTEDSSKATESPLEETDTLDSISILTKERRRVCREIIERINRM